MLASGADTRARANDGGGPPHAAALGGHAGVVRLLLDRGLGVNEAGRADGMTPSPTLPCAVICASWKYFCNGVRTSTSLTPGGNSPLLHAAMRGRIHAARLLLESGANVNAASKHGWTPLMAAAWEGDASVVAELLKHGADATLVNSERR